MPLRPELITEIKKLLRTAKISYDKELRTILFNDVDFLFYSRLKKFSSDEYQLAGDLNALNSTERLADGSCLDGVAGQEASLWSRVTAAGVGPACRHHTGGAPRRASGGGGAGLRK